MRYLGVDYGTQRIGLAVGSADTPVSPVKVLAATRSAEQNARAILEIAREYDAQAIVVGLPLNMDGSRGPQARVCEHLAGDLSRLADLPVHLHDERLTSHAADGRLRQRELTRAQKKARQDAVAAAIILESFLETQGTP